MTWRRNLSTYTSDRRWVEPIRPDPSDWNETPLALDYYVRVLWRQKIIILITMVVIIVIGGLYTYFQAPLYRSTAEMLLQPSITESLFNSVPSTVRGATVNRVETEIAVMRSRSVQEAVGKALGQLPVASINQRGDTDVVAITGVSATPEEAARTAQTYADTYIEIRREQLRVDLQEATNQIQALIDSVEQQLTELEGPVAALNDQMAAAATDVDRRQLQEQRNQLIRQTDGQRAVLQSRQGRYAEQLDRLILASSVSQTGGVQLVTNAEVPSAPASPKSGQNLAMTLALGLLLGVTAAFIREHFDNRRKEG
jgi:uncharacterized protein involved in exopolysaccharide biosynthesis